MDKFYETFLKLGAAFNCGERTAVNADIDDCAFNESDIEKTYEDAQNFGGKLEIEENGVKLYVLPNFQIRKGLRRGDLYTADFGDFRLVAFTGEGVIK